MALKMIFAPFKQLSLDYSMWVQLKSRNFPYGDDTFEKMIEKGLSDQYSKMYGNKSVKLIGYDYVQYDKNGWSYYPVQLMVKSQLQGISWIKWRCENKNNYFIFDVLCEKNLEMIPIEYSFCSNDENKRLSIKFPQPNFEYNICNNKYLKLVPNSVRLETSSYIFDYEYQRQMTKLYSKLTGISDIHKHLMLGTVPFKIVQNVNGYTYALSNICSKPYWALDSEYEVIIRWKSNTAKEYISSKDIISSNDVTFEFSPVIPLEIKKYTYNLTNIANKDDIINFIESNPHRKQPDPVFGTYFDVKVESMNYPDMTFILQLKKN